MIEIGDTVSIAEDAIILTHSYDWSIFKGMYGGMFLNLQAI